MSNYQPGQALTYLRELTREITFFRVQAGGPVSCLHYATQKLSGINCDNRLNLFHENDNNKRSDHCYCENLQGIPWFGSRDKVRFKPLLSFQQLLLSLNCSKCP